MIAKAKDGGEVWADDSIELFLFPLNAPAYTQLIVNSAGSRYNRRGDEKIKTTRTGSRRRLWEGGMVAGTAHSLCVFGRQGAEGRGRMAGECSAQHSDRTAGRTAYVMAASERTDSMMHLTFGRFVFRGIAGDKGLDEENEINRAYISRCAWRNKKALSMAENTRKNWPRRGSRRTSALRRKRCWQSGDRPASWRRTRIPIGASFYRRVAPCVNFAPEKR